MLVSASAPNPISVRPYAELMKQKKWDFKQQSGWKNVLKLISSLTPAGTSGRCTWASCRAGRRSTSGAGTGPWCSSTQTSTCCGCWRLSWSRRLSWSCSSALWSRRTEPRRCSVGGALTTPDGLTSAPQTAAQGVWKAKKHSSTWAQATFSFRILTSCPHVEHRAHTTQQLRRQ